MTDLLKAVGLTKEQVQNSKCIISIAPSLPAYFEKHHLNDLEAGKTLRGTPFKNPASKKRFNHPDLAHLDPRGYEYKREVSRRWRAAHPKGASSGSKVKV